MRSSIYIGEIIEINIPWYIIYIRDSSELLARSSLESCSQYICLMMFQLKTYVAKRFSCAAVASWNVISDNRLKNSEHVDDFCKRLKTSLLKKYS